MSAVEWTNVDLTDVVERVARGLGEGVSSDPWEGVDPAVRHRACEELLPVIVATRDAMAPYVGAMLDQARAEASSGCCACAGVAKAERDELRETLRLRSEALDRVVAENEDMRRRLVTAQALHKPIDALHTPTGRQTQVCSGCERDGDWQIWPCPTARALAGESR